MQTRFHIDGFSPSRLKKARLALEKHLARVQVHANTNDMYKLGVLKEDTLWQKFEKVFK